MNLNLSMMSHLRCGVGDFDLLRRLGDFDRDLDLLRRLGDLDLDLDLCLLEDLSPDLDLDLLPRSLDLDLFLFGDLDRDFRFL